MMLSRFQHLHAGQELPDMKILGTELKKMGEAHKACEMNVTLWAHLWIDHLLGWARKWGHIAIFAAFKGEGRHNPVCAQWCIFSIVRANFEKHDLGRAPIARTPPRYIVPFFKT